MGGSQSLCRSNDILARNVSRSSDSEFPNLDKGLDLYIIQVDLYGGCFV